MAVSEILRTHRSIRQYKSDPVDDALVQQVLEDAFVGSSSSGNLNSVSVVLTKDPGRKQRLFELHFEQPMVLQAPLVITFCADWWRTREWLRLRGARDNFDNFIGYHVAVVDAVILAQSACLGFEAHGLGICYMGTTLHSMEAIAEFLGLPETCIPITTIVVGHPAENPTKRDRLPPEGMIHYETYRMPDQAEIEATYAQREIKGWERYMAFPELRERIEAMGIKSLAEFYTSKAKYDPEIFERDSARLEDLLRKKRLMG